MLKKMPIRKLPDYVINRLKAGEIVERPSSILKELVENSLDANATKIEININDGGKSYLSIQDNGTGIELSDIDLLLERYATSKIRTDEDLYQIASYGFRGEALASIAEVSKITIITKTKYAQIGTKLQKKGGDTITTHTPIGYEHGTFIAIEDLFFNVPARLKFLKSAQTEYFYCYSYFVNIALMHCDKEFILRKNNNLIFCLKPETLTERISNIYKQNRSSKLKEFNSDDNYLKINGVIGDPSLRFGSSENIKIFVNNRPIQDKIIKKAILDAYERQITPGEYPFCIISIKINPKDVDVNVHPSKLQVKFSDSKKVYEIINSKIQDTLGHNKISTQQQGYIPTSREIPFSNLQNTKTISKQVELFDKVISNSEIQQNKAQSIFGLNSFTPENEGQDFFNQEIGEYKIIGQLRNSYIIIQTNDALFYVDQHALAERISFENMKKNQDLTTTNLLQPLKYEVTNIPNLTEKIEELNKLGFDISSLGTNVIIIYAVPQIFVTYPIDFQTLFNHVLYLENITFNHLIDGIYASKACKTSIKAGNKLSLPQMEQLINDGFEQIPGMFVCQHGRPFFVKIERSEINGFFDRN